MRIRTRREAEENAAMLRGTGKPTAVLVGFSAWKTFMVGYLPEYNVVFLDYRPRIRPDLFDWIALFPEPTVFVWSYKGPKGLQAYCHSRHIELVFVEDAFVRGVGLGRDKTKPLSLAFDRRAMHFDRSQPSDLETILATHDFDADQALMEEARALLALVRNEGVTKYNFATVPTELTAESDPSRECILVLGQMESDLSIRYGLPNPMSNIDLIKRAHQENPGARILYRPHPEARRSHLAHVRWRLSTICDVLPRSTSLHACFASAARVYAMMSLAGFEAALFGLPVKLFGNPFYGGWGFTEDVHPLARRGRRLTPLQVLAGAYVLYPRYFDPVTDRPMDALPAIRMAIESRNARRAREEVQGEAVGQAGREAIG